MHTDLPSELPLFPAAKKRPSSRRLPGAFSRIAVTAPKGGVGKTFVTCNLAFYLHQSRMQARPCVIDFGAHSRACKWIGGSRFSDEAFHRDGAFAMITNDGLVLTRCEDWDKIRAEKRYEKRNQAFQQVMSNPRAGNPLRPQIEDFALMEACDYFAYDTDHYITTYTRFLLTFDRVVILFDANDEGSMDNLVESWKAYSQENLGALIKKRPRKTFIVANKARSGEQALARLLKVAKMTLCRETQEYQDRALGELESFFVIKTVIPKFTTSQVERAVKRSVPIWETAPAAKDVFRELAKILK